MKRTLCIALVLVLVLSTSLFGQGKKEKEPEVVVEFFHTTWVPQMLEILEFTIAEFEAQNPGIKIVETRTNWTDAPSQLMTSIMGGKSPDLIMTNPPMLAQFRGIGALADISGYISQEFMDNLLPVAKDMITTVDGKIDGLPQEGCNWALFYRKDLFEQAGLDPNKPPTTWEELVTMGRKLTKDTSGDGKIDQWAYGWPVQAENANDYWVNFLQQAGADITVPTADGSWKSMLLEPEVIQATNFMVDLVRKEKIAPASIVDMDWEGVTNAFVSGEVAMMHNGAWVVGSVKEKGPELDGKWGTALLFSGPAGAAYRGHPNTFNILEASKAKDEAWKFLEFFYNEPSPFDEGLSLAGSFCNASGGMLYTYDYIDFAKDAYEELLQPFLWAYEGAKIPPLDPHWMTLSNMFVQSRVQQMLMGELSVYEALRDLDQNLKSLQSE